MKTKYQIEQINYDLISRLTNLNPQDRTLLLGHNSKFVAIKSEDDKSEAIIETLGKRDECANKLKSILALEAVI
jgi:uncharacterized membrane protein